MGVAGGEQLCVQPYRGKRSQGPSRHEAKGSLLLGTGMVCVSSVLLKRKGGKKSLI